MQGIGQQLSQPATSGVNSFREPSEPTPTLAGDHFGGRAASAKCSVQLPSRSIFRCQQSFSTLHTTT